MGSGRPLGLSRSSPSCLNRPAQRTDFVHGLLSALIVVDRLQLRSADTHDRLRAAAKLRDLLHALAIPLDIPARHTKLIAFAQKNRLSDSDTADSSAALVKFRHGFVHANERHREVVFSAEGKAATVDAWLLSLWYQELALLYLLDHQGTYRNRITSLVERVPWA